MQIGIYLRNGLTLAYEKYNKNIHFNDCFIY